MRRNLVVLRAGDNSLHRAWLKCPPEERNWDLVVSWFGTEPYSCVDDERVINIKGGKWDGLSRTFESLPLLAEAYDFIWLPDDDIHTDCSSINRLFDVTREEGLSVSQPALTWDSYFTHPHTVRWPGFHLRYTNMVEVMMPCLSRDTLAAVLPYFSGSMTGWGLDWIWTRLGHDNAMKAAIFDSVSMTHTRPLGLVLRRIAAKSGEDSELERQRLMAAFGLRRERQLASTYRAVSRGGVQWPAAACLVFATVIYFCLAIFGRENPNRSLRLIPRLWRSGGPDLSQLRAHAGPINEVTGSAHGPP